MASALFLLFGCGQLVQVRELIVLYFQFHTLQRGYSARGPYPVQTPTLWKGLPVLGAFLAWWSHVRVRLSVRRDAQEESPAAPPVSGSNSYPIARYPFSRFSCIARADIPNCGRMSRALGNCEIRDDHPSKWRKVVSVETRD
jgi:hypothetical protein